MTKKRANTVNSAMNQGTSVCIGESQKDTNGYDALISEINLSSGSGNNKLVIQIVYGFGEDGKVKKEKHGDESISLKITLRINGKKFDTQDLGYNEDETSAIVLYLLNLLEIRGDHQRDYYISKVLLFSNTLEMKMLYL